MKSGGGISSFCGLELGIAKSRWRIWQSVYFGFMGFIMKGIIHLSF